MHLLSLLLASLSLLPPLYGRDYCALEITVKGPTGKPISPIGIAAIHDGHVFGRTQTDRQGVAKICDTPPGRVDLEIGGNACGSLTVRNLTPKWMEALKVPVTFEACSEEFYLPRACFFVIRVRDPFGRAISGALFHTPDEHQVNYRQTIRSDVYGRVFRVTPKGTSLLGQIEKVGYRVGQVEGVCQPGDPIERELEVVLHEDLK